MPSLQILMGGIGGPTSPFVSVSAELAAAVAASYQAAANIQTGGSYGPRAAPSTPTGPNVVTVPGSIDPTGATDVGAALASWGQSNQGNGKTLVYPSGAIYRCSTSFIVGNSSTIGTTFWLYGAKFNMTGLGSSINHSGIYCPTTGGNNKIYGGEIAGANMWAGTNASYFGHPTNGGSGENGHGITTAHNGSNPNMEIADVWIHNIFGDGIYGSGNAGSKTDGLWLHHNLIELNGRQLVTMDAGDDVTIEWNILRDASMQALDIEDSLDGLRTVRRLHFQFNQVNRWNWYFVPSGTTPRAGQNFYENIPIACVNHVGTLADVRDIYFENNQLQGGSKGYGSGGAYGGLGANFGLFWMGNNQPTPIAKTNLYIRNNDFAGIPAAQHVGPGIGTSNVTNLNVTGNTGMTGLTVVHTADTAPTIVSGNT